jgi:hypothetical protein
MSFVIGMLLFGVLGAVRYGLRSGAILGLVAMSHWVLDLIVHRADRPVLPGEGAGLPRLGLSLWKYPVGAAMLELMIVAVGSWLYWRAARRLAGADHTVACRANLCGVVVLGSGAITLVLNVIGL